MSTQTVFTIGHSRHDIRVFIHLLQRFEIERLVDVRTAPYSRFFPHFNKLALEAKLKPAGIDYRFAGKLLGGRPADPTCYKSGRLPEVEEGHADYLNEVDYRAVMEKPFFQRGIEHLMTLAELSPTAMMCSEEDPSTCHRHHLIAKYLMERYPSVEILHIRGDEMIFNAKSLHVSVEKEPVQQLSLL